MCSGFLFLPGNNRERGRLYVSGTIEGCTKMSRHAESCVAHAARCMEVAAKACTDEDRREFLSFADAWDKLAIEIELSERLVAFIDELATNIDADAVPEGSEPPRRSYTQPLRQLAAAMVAISDHVASDATARHLALLLKRQARQA
jgi:hypothetical protein